MLKDNIAYYITYYAPLLKINLMNSFKAQKKI